MEYGNYKESFKRVWRYLNSVGDSEKAISEVVELRGYSTIEGIEEALSEIGFLWVPSGAVSVNLLRKEDPNNDLGLYTIPKNGRDGRFLLEDRYVFPVRSFSGDVIALIGWFPDQKKYITTPSKYFAKNTMYFGMEQMGSSRLEKTILVEGIFDSILARMSGYPCLAAMGVTVGSVKRKMYPLMGKILAIPDADRAGIKIYKGDTWKLPLSGRYFRWSGQLELEEDVKISIKDIDLFARVFDISGLKYSIDAAFEAKSGRVQTMKL